MIRHFQKEMISQVFSRGTGWDSALAGLDSEPFDARSEKSENLVEDWGVIDGGEIRRLWVSRPGTYRSPPSVGGPRRHPYRDRDLTVVLLYEDSSSSQSGNMIRVMLCNVRQPTGDGSFPGGYRKDKPNGT